MAAMCIQRQLAASVETIKILHCAVMACFWRVLWIQGLMSIGRVFNDESWNEKEKAKLDAERFEARSPNRPRMFDDMPEHLKDLEELLYLVRVNDFPKILGHPRYWLSQAMHEVQRLRNLSGEKIRLKTRAPESLNGRPEMEKYEYAREMLEILIKENRNQVFSPTNYLDLRSWCFLMAAVWCIILAMVDFDGMWIYDLSKWALCGVCAYTGFRYWKEGSRRLLVPLGIMAVIFNPIAPIRFGDAWTVVNVLAGATFLGVFLWDAGWIEKAWKNRKKIGVYAFMGALACFAVSILAGTYLDLKSGGPERRAADLKSKREKADAAARERLMKSFGEKKAPKEEPRRYPRALPGGGLDWTGVPGGPRE